MFEIAVEEINQLRPDVIIVTGDLTEDGLLTEFREAKKYLETLRCKRVLICAGNHDYRSTGYLIFKSFFPPRRVCEIENVVIVTIGTARPDRDEGEVGYRQIVSCSRILKRKRMTKVVAMHHHLVQVPDTGTDRITVIDAGDTLRALINSGVSLVLCGHRHRPWEWNLEDMKILHAGSVSSQRLRGFFSNCYSIVEIERGEIEAKLKVVGGKEISFAKIVAESREVPLPVE
jgi:3',5'-cyclic AMP phosphodiesterase CpdA